MNRPRLVVVASLALLSPVAAWAEARAPAQDMVRLGVHPGFGRIVFAVGADTRYSIDRDGDVATIHFSRSGPVPGLERSTRNVTRIEGGESMATITLTPGARIRPLRLSDRVVLDILDPVRADRPLRKHTLRAVIHPVEPEADKRPPDSAPTIATAPTEVVTAVALPAESAKQLLPEARPHVAADESVADPESAASAAGHPSASDVAVLPSAPAAASTASAPADQLALSAEMLSTPGGTKGKTVLLPFEGTVGAAAFPRGGTAWIVFDERRPLDLEPLHDDPVLGHAKVQLLATATVVSMPLPPGTALRLARRPTGWAVSVQPVTGREKPVGLQPTSLSPIVPQTQDDHLLLPATAGGVVAVLDRDTGQNLLVGTVRGAGEAVAVSYQIPELIVHPSWQGIVVEPLSDGVSLRTATNGFVLQTGTRMSPAPPAARALSLAGSLTRRYAFAAEPPAVLLRRLQSQVAEAGEAPPLARARPRKAAAETMISLGLGAEAQSLLRLAFEEDPRLLTDSDAQELAAIAALLCGRDDEAGALRSATPPNSDEVALWRAALVAHREENAPNAAPVFAATLPLILSYPEALQNRLLPLAVETMAIGGATEVADAVLAARSEDARLAYARALRLQAQGDEKAALAAYDTLADGRDRFGRTRAAVRAIELRLEMGEITKSDAAVAMERQFISWRGDTRERDLRIRAALLRAQAGEWRPALNLLRETVGLYPEDTAEIDLQRANILGALIASTPDTISALDLVTLADENAELVATVAPQKIAELLAEKLVSLDLPRRAVPILSRMAAAAAPGSQRATLGQKLAAMRFAAGDDHGAADALASTNAPDLPAALTEQRTLLNARILARGGEPGRAAGLLAAINTPAGDELRGALLTDAQDWRAAAKATQDWVSKIVPESGPLDPAQQDALLRLASVTQSAGESAELLALGRREADRVTGARAGLFRLLTAAPVEGVGDLRRASTELALARGLPTAMASVGAR